MEIICNKVLQQFVDEQMVPYTGTVVIKLLEQKQLDLVTNNLYLVLMMLILTFWIIIVEQNMEKESFPKTYVLILFLILLQKSPSGQTKKCTLTTGFLQCHFCKY